MSGVIIIILLFIIGIALFIAYLRNHLSDVKLQAAFAIMVIISSLATVIALADIFDDSTEPQIVVVIATPEPTEQKRASIEPTEQVSPTLELVKSPTATVVPPIATQIPYPYPSETLTLAPPPTEISTSTPDPCDIDFVFTPDRWGIHPTTIPESHLRTSDTSVELTTHEHWGAVYYDFREVDVGCEYEISNVQVTLVELFGEGNEGNLASYADLIAEAHDGQEGGKSNHPRIRALIGETVLFNPFTYTVTSRVGGVLRFSVATVADTNFKNRVKFRFDPSQIIIKPVP